MLYYTANKIPETFANNVRDHLLSMLDGIPIVSVSQKPLDFGENICVGEIGQSAQNVYRQILVGARSVKTKFLACCEDDTLHDREYFTIDPPSDYFYYNHRWNVMPDYFYYRKGRYGMCTCVAPTELMISTLEDKFKRYEQGITEVASLFAEPGRRERKCGLKLVKVAGFETKVCSLTFKHWNSLSGVSRILTNDVLKESLPFWGNASDLWERFYGYR